MGKTGIAFSIWAVCGAAFIGLGIYCYFSKKSTAFGFWANAEMFEVDDIKGYNRALGKLWFVYGVVFIILGIPLIGAGQNSPFILLSVIGAMFETIGIMVIYIVKIEKKYRKK